LGFSWVSLWQGSIRLALPLHLHFHPVPGQEFYARFHPALLGCQECIQGLVLSSFCVCSTHSFESFFEGGCHFHCLCCLRLCFVCECVFSFLVVGSPFCFFFSIYRWKFSYLLGVFIFFHLLCVHHHFLCDLAFESDVNPAVEAYFGMISISGRTGHCLAWWMFWGLSVPFLKR
jgi:hypothetical protein